jgi:hypothetical protein
MGRDCQTLPTIPPLTIPRHSVLADRRRICERTSRIAREEFGMVRGEKEILYRFGDAPSTSGDKPR